MWMPHHGSLFGALMGWIIQRATRGGSSEDNILQIKGYVFTVGHMVNRQRFRRMIVSTLC